MMVNDVVMREEVAMDMGMQGALAPTANTNSSSST
jgi:hypothetical protein